MMWLLTALISFVVTFIVGAMLAGGLFGLMVKAVGKVLYRP